MQGPPDRIGRYSILSRLGAGGMGEVFLGHDERLDRKVAIKRLLPDGATDSKALARLLVEARAVAKLEHPNICGIYEVGEDPSGPFIVMPLVEGQTLAVKLEAGPLPIRDAIAFAAQIADALAEAHAHDILHRDIKPANVIVNSRGQLRVMDFGLAKVAASDSAHSAAVTVDALTRMGTTLGTVQYMSPEQARGEQLDGRSDIFSLGAVLYEMITGHRAFDAPSVAGILVATQTSEPPPLSTFRPDAPDELQRIVSKALKKSPAERYQSTADLAIDLRAALGRSSGRVSEAHTSARSAVPRSRAAYVRWALAGVATVAAALTLAFVLQRGGTRPAAPPSAGASGDISSLAVLPLVNNSGNADKEYVADGITESLIRSLSQLPKLTVLSRNTVFRFKGKTDQAQKIAGQLGVAAVMTGIITKADDQLVIDIELSDARTSAVILSQRYVEPSTRVPAAESNIAQDVARHLRAKLSGDDERAVRNVGTTNSEAYQLYLRGRFFDNKQTPEAIHQAVSYFEQSVALDPSYALAYAALGQAYLELGLYFDAPKDTMPHAKHYAEQALALEPNLVDGHIVAGLVALTYDWNYEDAAKATTVNGRMLPEAVAMFTCATHLLESTGHSAEAGGEIREALALDPLSGPLNTELGCNAYYSRQYDEAIRGYRAALQLDADNVVAYWGLGKALNQKQEYSQALVELRKLTSRGDAPPIIVSVIGCSYAALGQRDAARRTLDELKAMSKQVYVDPYLTAGIYAALNDKTRALDELERAYDLRSGFLISLPREPQWDAIRDEPRYKALITRLGFPA